MINSLRWRKCLNYFIVLIIFVAIIQYVAFSSLHEKAKKKLGSVDVKINEIHQNNEWLFNHNIFQFSSYLIVLGSKKVRIESMVLPVGFGLDKSNTQCVLRKTNGSLIIHSVMEVFYQSENLSHKSGSVYAQICKVICEYAINEEFVDHQSIVAIVEKNRYQENTKQFDTEQKIIPVSYLQFQVPKIIDARGLKKQALAHCVHSVYDLDVITTPNQVIFDPSVNSNRFNSMVHFLSMQYDMGIDQIRLYLKRQRSNTDFFITEKFKNLSVVYYPLSYAEICRMQITQSENSPGVNVYDHLLQQCRKGYQLLFQAIVVAGTWTMHEKLASNDCYINYRYTHEFITNYDFDELIIPHAAHMGDLQVQFSDMNSSKTSICAHQPSKFNLYEHAVRLLKQNNQAAYLALDHVIIAQFTSELTEFFSTMDRQLKTHTDLTTVLQVKYKNMVFEISNGEEVAYAKQLVKLYNLANDMYQNYLSRDKYLNFNRAVAFRNPTRLGKSIYNTMRCEMINVHNADVYHGGRAVDISSKDAFVSHFRDETDWFLEQPNTYSIKFIYIDIEYYHFILRTYNDFQCK
jgi:hypothetical protein